MKTATKTNKFDGIDPIYADMKRLVFLSGLSLPTLKKHFKTYQPAPTPYEIGSRILFRIDEFEEWMERNFANENRPTEEGSSDIETNPAATEKAQ